MCSCGFIVSFSTSMGSAIGADGANAASEDKATFLEADSVAIFVACCSASSAKIFSNLSLQDFECTGPSTEHALQPGEPPNLVT